jgi:hypothetical protein
MKPLFSEKTTTVARIVFENIRNTVVCASVAVAGLVVARFQEMSFLGKGLAPWISLVILICASLLVMWNILVGFSQVHDALPAKSASIFVCLYLPILFIYFVIATSIFGGLTKLPINSLRSSSATAKISSMGSPANEVFFKHLA